MNVEYDLLPEDIFAFHHFQSYGTDRTSTGRKVFWSVMAVICIGLLVVLFLATQSWQAGLAMIIPLVFVLTALFRDRIAHYQINQMLRKEQNAKWLGFRSLTIAPENLNITTELSANCILWSGVHKIKSTDDYAYLYTSSSEAIVIPTRAFRNDKEFDQFVAKAIEYRKIAQSQEDHSD
jgi:hypothetical protein